MLSVSNKRPIIPFNVFNISTATISFSKIEAFFVKIRQSDTIGINLYSLFDVYFSPGTHYFFIVVSPSCKKSHVTRELSSRNTTGKEKEERETVAADTLIL